MRIVFLLSVCLFHLSLSSAFASDIKIGARPGYLVNQLEDGRLKSKLSQCLSLKMKPSKFSIGHRGAPLKFPEHTAQSYKAAAFQGAGIIECDVTFTKDKELICRHSQNDLHETTNILTSELADTCIKAFSPASEEAPASAECRTSDITLRQFRSLHGRMDGVNKQAKTAEEYANGTASWLADRGNNKGILMTHAESIALINSLGADFTPELKAPAVQMPFEGFSQRDYAQKMIDEYKTAGIAPSRVWPQSFDLDDIKYWIEHEPEFGKQAVYLDDRFFNSDEDEGLIDPNDPNTFKPSMSELKTLGVNYIAPPLWMLVTLKDQKIVPSAYAYEAKAAGLSIIAWTVERSGSLNNGGGWYYQSITDITDNDGVVLKLLDALAQDVGVVAVFSDWPATTTFYANCMGL